MKNDVGSRLCALGFELVALGSGISGHFELWALGSGGWDSRPVLFVLGPEMWASGSQLSLFGDRLSAFGFRLCDLG